MADHKGKPMAKLSAHGAEVARLELYSTTGSATYRFRVMSDAVVLRQWRYEGRWEAPTVAFRPKGHRDPARMVRALHRKYGVNITEVPL